MNNVRTARVIAVGLSCMLFAQDSLFAMSMRERFSAGFSHKVGSVAQAVGNRFCQAKELLSHSSKKATAAVARVATRRNINSALDKADTVIKKTLGVAAACVSGAVCLSALGSAGYCAQEFAEKGSDEKALLGVASAGLGACSVWAFGPTRTALLGSVVAAGWAARKRFVALNRCWRCAGS